MRDDIKSGGDIKIVKVESAKQQADDYLTQRVICEIFKNI
jgi:hypothetical protein